MRSFVHHSLVGLLFGTSAILPLGACSSAASTQATTSNQAVEQTSDTGCVVANPIAEDGYTEFGVVDPSNVTRKIIVDGQLVDDPQKTITPDATSISATTKKINRYLDTINALPDNLRRREVYSQNEIAHGRDKPTPYCLFHQAGQAIYGTVLLFHGFTAEPHQQGKLASYLFHNGFNVYNVFIGNEFMVDQNTKSVNGVAASGGDATKLWPRTMYNPSVLATLQAKFSKPENQLILSPILAQIQQGGPSSDLTPQQQGTIESVLEPELSLTDFGTAWADPESPSYAKLFNVRDPNTDGTAWLDSDSAADRATKMAKVAATADYMDYVRDAAARMDELSPLGGPVFVGGLSIGGELAFAAAENDGGAHVRAVMTHSPWLQDISASSNEQLRIAGPLDSNINAVSPGNYPLVWDGAGQNIAFSPASTAANLALGAWVQKHRPSIAKIPTATVMTAADDSADNVATNAFITGLVSDLTNDTTLTLAPSDASSLHVTATYPVDKNVGHAMTDPENYPDGAPRNWNHYFRRLYQESFRFYLTGKLDPNGTLATVPQDPDLPAAACVIPDFNGRCNVQD